MSAPVSEETAGTKPATENVPVGIATEDQPASALPKYWRIGFAPILMVLVAAVQIFNAHTSNLSPWKCGGFGMFSAVDSPRERFVRIHLITADGQNIPVKTPNPLASAKMALRASPTNQRAEDMARTMMHYSWGDTDGQWHIAARKTQAVDDGQAVVGIDAFRPDLSAPNNPVPIERGRIPPIGAIGRVAPGSILEFTGVRVEVLRLVMDREKNILSAKPILHAQFPPEGTP